MVTTTGKGNSPQKLAGPWGSSRTPVLVLRTRVVDRVLLRILALPYLVFALFFLLAMPSVTATVVIVLSLATAFIVLDHAARLIVFLPEELWVKGLLRWRPAGPISSLHLTRRRRQFDLWRLEGARRRHVLRVYPEFLRNEEDVTRLEELLPKHDSAACN